MRLTPALVLCGAIMMAAYLIVMLSNVVMGRSNGKLQRISFRPLQDLVREIGIGTGPAAWHYALALSQTPATLLFELRSRVHEVRNMADAAPSSRRNGKMVCRPMFLTSSKVLADATDPGQLRALSARQDPMRSQSENVSRSPPASSS